MGRPAERHSGLEVFEILMCEHTDMLVAYLRSLVRTPDVVDDLFQETSLVAWRRLGDYDHSRPFGPWLRGIATRLVLQHRRRAAGAMLNCDPMVLEALECRYRAIADLPGDTFRERLDRIITCLSRLPRRLREAVELAYARGLLLRQIARSLNESEEAIKKRVQRARLLLAECVRRAEVQDEH